MYKSKQKLHSATEDRCKKAVNNKTHLHSFNNTNNENDHDNGKNNY